jgi:Cu2+-exporting ATPase
MSNDKHDSKQEMTAGHKRKGHEAMGHNMQAGHGGKGGHEHQSHHAHMVADFRRRFWVSLVITIPVLILSPLIQELLGLKDIITFPGDSYVLWVLASAIFFYGGYPFLKGIFDELKYSSGNWQHWLTSCSWGTGWK